jgi:alpha-L-fucosidase
LEISLEELFEGFENEEVEIDISTRKGGTPIFGASDWTKMPESIIEKDYQFCSDAGYEKFLDMKFGLFMHWGQYSVLGVTESWTANAKNCPRWFLDTYYTLYQSFNPTDFNADEWAALAERAGMQFFILTTKHHDGFSLWDTKTTTKARRRIGAAHNVAVNPVEDCEIHYSMMDTTFKVDIIAEVVRAFRKKNLGIGLYFSHIDWNDPNFRWDPANRSFDPTYTPKTHPEAWKAFIERERQQLHELFTNYGKLDMIFFDGTWFGLAWNEMKQILKELRRLQPDCMFSDRGTGPYADFTSPERWIPVDTGDKRVRQKAWQVCDVIGTHWSHVPDERYKDKNQLLRSLIEIVAKGGTYAFNVPPMGNGKFPEKSVEILEYMGRWLKVNGEAIYATRTRQPYCQGENLYFTKSKDSKILYAIHIGWPHNQVEINEINPLESSEIFMLGIQKPLPWRIIDKKLIIEIPIELNQMIPCEFAFSFKIILKK